MPKAKLGDIILDTVYSENPKYGVKVTEHPIEDGESIADHVERETDKMDLSGVLTGPDAPARLIKILSYQKQGKLLNYVYRNGWFNVVIESFNTTHDVDVKGGLKFSMTLVQVRIAKPSVLAEAMQTKAVSSAGRKQPTG
ncbi:phage baseplate protein [Bacillus thuringiensis]|uniref:phage baseplate protein n=1 Tax=Bacillus thuringiensis TaxID=1428 RepID=UPI0039859F1F